MEANRDKFMIDAEYDGSKGKIEYVLYRSSKFVWSKIASSRNVNKLYKIMDKLQDYPKVFIGKKRED